MIDADVAIVGAGVAGLAAARSLVDAGRSVTVLESRDRIGGRLVSSSPSDPGADLGATWFWPNEHRIVSLIGELGLETFAHHLDGNAMYDDAERTMPVDGNPLDVPSGRFVRGAASVTRALVDRLPEGSVHLGEPVQAVHGDGATGLAVRTPERVVNARHVLLALPPALAVHRIAFEPELPSDLAGLARATPVWMGTTAKVVVGYDRPFWRDAGLAGSAMSHRGPIRELHDMSGRDGEPARLFGFVPTRDGHDAPGEAAVVEQLVRLFGPSAATPTSVAIKDWRLDPDTSPPHADRLTNYRTYGHPLWQRAHRNGRLHFISTETSVEAPGHIEGALAAADRAVAHILSAPDPNTTERSDTPATSRPTSPLIRSSGDPTRTPRRSAGTSGISRRSPTSWCAT